jgi:hypothetical protein
VDEFVVHVRVHALVRGERLVGVAQRRHLERHAVVGHGAGARVAAVGEVDEEQVHLFLRSEAEDLRLELEGVLEGLAEVRDQKALGAARVDDAQAVGLDCLELGGNGRRDREESECRGRTKPEGHEISRHKKARPILGASGTEFGEARVASRGRFLDYWFWF